MDILINTMKTTQSVVSAMAAVVASWNGQADNYTRKYGCHSSIESIQCLYPQVRTQLSSTRQYLVEHWLDIEENRMLQDEVKRYMDSLELFFGNVRNFENEFCSHYLNALDTFNDAWIARKYFVMMLEQLSEYDSLLHEFHDFGKQKASPARPFRGMAAAFRSYFVGVKDDELESLVLYHKIFDRKHEWLGTRVEATVFAEAYGITAKRMNKCFNIKGSNGFHRDLSLSGDKATLCPDQYGIWAAIEKYKHCTV